MIACESGNTKGTKHSKGSELVVGGDRIDSDTEFLILASNGIWEVIPRIIRNFAFLVIRMVSLRTNYTDTLYDLLKFHTMSLPF